MLLLLFQCHTVLRHLQRCLRRPFILVEYLRDTSQQSKQCPECARTGKCKLDFISAHGSRISLGGPVDGCHSILLLLQQVSRSLGLVDQLTRPA